MVDPLGVAATRLHQALVGVAMAPFTLACGSDSGVPGTRGSADAGADARANDAARATGDVDAIAEHGPLGQLDLKPCDKPEFEDVDAECATVRVPQHWDAPNDGDLDVFVWCVRQPGSMKQLWGLAGGPGQASWSFRRLTLGADGEPPLAPYGADLDVCGVDPRGTGYSSFLAGAPENVEVASRYAYTEVARDLDALIQATRKPGQQVFVYGVSAGTFWAQRYLQITATPPHGVILDSPVDPTTPLWPRPFEQHFDDTGHALLDLCAADAFCGQKLGTDPWAKLGELYRELRSGHCMQVQDSGLDESGLKGKLGSMVDARSQRGAIPALIYRYLRCSPEDVSALTHAPEPPSGSQPPLPTGSSLSTLVLVGASELYETPAPTPAEIEAYISGLRMAQGTGRVFAIGTESWPLYPRDEYAGRIPETEVPILLLSGELDPRTPPQFADHLDAMLSGPHFSVRTPRGSHGQLRGSPIEGSEQHCASLVVRRFLDDPTAHPDATCMQQVEGIDFRGTEATARMLFGTDDLWGD